jgi:hypothetical protein
MILNSLELSQTINFILIILSLLGVLILFSIVKRTKDKMRRGLTYVLLGLLVYVSLQTLQLFSLFQIISQTLIPDILEILFITLLVLGMWKFQSLVKNLSDYGQALVLTSKEKYDDTLVSIVKNTRRVCYVTMEKPFNNIIDLFKLYNIETASMYFIDATGKKTVTTNVLSIQNTPEDIKRTLEKVLKEKTISVVVIDNISAIKTLKNFELSRFVQDMTLLIKANRAQGFFIGKLEDLGIQTLNDISMFVDKVTGDEKW